MKYYLVAGEASGDLHGANLMKGLRKSDPEAEFRYFGGDLMQAEGGTLVKHFRDTAFMGLFMVLANIRVILKNLRLCKLDILSFAPDAVILIDYPGFNLKIAEFAHKNALKVFYYISPKIWAWRKSRVYKIKEFVDKMYVLLPFEVEFYQQYNYHAEFLGNPTVDAVDTFMHKTPEPARFRSANNLDSRPVIALLPGSRKQEIHHCLPEMIKASEAFPAFQFIIAGAPSILPEFYQIYLGEKKIPVIYNKTYELLIHSFAAVVVSGTATLETGLLKVPQLVIYKPGILTYRIGIHIVKIKFFSLVNLFMDKEVVKEFLQFNIAEEIRQELKKITENDSYRNEMLQNYEILREKAGSPGASLRVAVRIVEYLKSL
jgi:lipid-A-disaccharide synthase